MSGANLNAQPWSMVLADDAPNPVIGERPTRDGGTARLYANGLVDAVDGLIYSISPGFDDYAELDAWILDRLIELHEGAARYGREHPYAGTCGEDDAQLDQLDALKAERDSMRR